MSIRTTPPFRADHVGSLLRPPELHAARDDFAAGRIDADALHAVEDAAITDAVKLQEDVGIQAVTDGEFRRASWHMDFIYELGGIREDEERMHVQFHNAAGDIEFSPAKARVYDTLTLPKTIFGDHFTYLESQVTKGVPKLTIPSPSMVHYRSGRPYIDTTAYPDMESFWSDLSATYAQEITQLRELGCTYLQMDDTCFAYLNDANQRKEIAERGEDAEHLHLRYVKQINEAVANRPEDMTLTVHMCRGNFRSSWVAEGGYDYVAEPLLSDLDVDGYFMEFDDDRSGGFEPLRFVPKGKFIVLGLITSKRPELESKDEIKRRLEAASKYVPMEQLCLSPQCGFSSTAEGNSLTIEEQKAKLRLVVEIADEVWG
jgi:5-methyltetrahydropteroyltriglutamate--homocysteine methyltransferase